MTTKSAAPWTQDAEEVQDIPAENAVAIIPPSSVAVATPAATTGGYSTDLASMISIEDVEMPRLQLAQPLSETVTDGDAKPGQWTLTGHEPENSAEFVILTMARKRELRDKDDQKVVHCRSDDGVTGHGDPGGDCANCPMAQWGAKGAGAPPCTFIYSYQAYSLTHHQLCLVDFKKTGISAAKRVNQFLMTSGLRGFVAITGSKQQKGPKGTYYVPTIERRNLTEEEIAELEECVPF